MKVFISWSGSRSKDVATVLKSTVPEILAGNVDTFISSEDIQKGERGLAVIAQELADTDYGVVVLTRANVNAQWINFESGALGRSLGTSRVSPLLVDLPQKDVTGPLTQFQMTDGSRRDDVHKLFQDINSACERPMPGNAVTTLFDAHWSKIEEVLSRASQQERSDAQVRPTDDILEEILERVRALGRGMSVSRREPEIRPTTDLLTDLIDPAYISSAGSMYKDHNFTEAHVTLKTGAPQLDSSTLARIAGLAQMLNGTIRINREDSWIEYSPEGTETRSEA